MTNCKSYCWDPIRLSLLSIIGYFTLLDPKRSLCDLPLDGISSWILFDFLAGMALNGAGLEATATAMTVIFITETSPYGLLYRLDDFIDFVKTFSQEAALLYKASFDSSSSNPLSPVRYRPSSTRSAPSNLTSVRPS